MTKTSKPNNVPKAEICHDNSLPIAKVEICHDNSLPIAKAEIIKCKYPRILVRNESNILPASIYKKNNNLPHRIEIIGSNIEKVEGDIYYNFI